MARNDTFFLRTTVDTSAALYQSSDIEISAFTDPSRGRVLVVDRAWVTYMTNGNGPIQKADIAGAGVAATRSIGVQATSETHTNLVDANDNSLFLQGSMYATGDTADEIVMYEEVSSMNPFSTVAGFIIPTDKIHCAIDCQTAWALELSVGFVFEVHTEKLSLQRIQELLVSLTAN
jgi:hypothetical protein